MDAVPIQQDVKYLAELFTKLDFDPRLAIADNTSSRVYNVYAFSVAPLITDPANYFILWGGTFDNPVGFGMQIFMGLFLTEVFTKNAMELTDNSFYVDKTAYVAYINIPKKPWEYDTAFSGFYTNVLSTFTNAPKNVDNPSDMQYDGISVDARMSPPTLRNELNEILAGINVYNSFSITIANEDGEYDGLDVRSFFNTPLQISKTVENAQSIEEFNRIRFGFIFDIKVTFDKLTVYAVDRAYLFNSSVCRVFTRDDYPNLIDANLNKDIPQGWGTLTKLPVFEVDKDTADPPLWAEYIVLDPDFITAVTTVFSDSGKSLTFSFTAATGIVRVTTLDDDGEVIEADSATVTGLTDNSIGNIIIKAIADNENIPYIPSLWDTTETDLYLALCADVGFYFSGGQTRDLIEQVLRNDLAFLIQKNNDLLTVRQWGQTYNTVTIPQWLSTKEPEKNFQDASKFFCSSVKVLYNKNHVADSYLKTFLDSTREREIFEAYRRSFTALFETDLLLEAAALELASRILDRFGAVRETVTIGLGVDTFEFNLLDNVRTEIKINERQFSEYSTWIIKAADPGQDVLKIEGIGIGYILSFDGDAASLDGDLFEVVEGE